MVVFDSYQFGQGLTICPTFIEICCNNVNLYLSPINECVFLVFQLNFFFFFNKVCI